MCFPMGMRLANAFLYDLKYLAAVQRERHTSTTKATIAGVALAIVLVVLLAFIGGRAFEQFLEPDGKSAAGTSPATTLSTAESEAHQGFIFGRVTTNDGAIYEGRLRFGGDE